ncbi:MAG TPA: PaaI family thioesterase [Burkholderiaceae bacterium]|nr:PaaI family thioesterase [Burkholderiaceae bacterium]
MTTPVTPDVMAALQTTLRDVFASWVRELELRLIDASPGEVRLALPVHPRHVHAGNVMSGQTLMAAADTAMVLAVTSKLGEFKPMTTVQLQTTFLRPVAPDAGDAMVVAKVLRIGRTLAFGEIEITTGDGALAAHATTTYALL